MYSKVFILLMLTCMNMKSAFIYTLTDPRDGKIKYVGKTINIDHRFKSHLWKNKNDKTIKNHWIQHLIKQGLKPEIETIDIVPECQWQFWEQYWICQVKSWGFSLKNGDNGGLGFDRYNEATKNKIRKTLIGKEHPDFYVGYSQFDLNGNFIKTFKSLKEIKAEFNLRTTDSNISTACRFHTTALGFIWIKNGINEL